MKIFSSFPFIKHSAVLNFHITSHFPRDFVKTLDVLGFKRTRKVFSKANFPGENSPKKIQKKSRKRKKNFCINFWRFDFFLDIGHSGNFKLIFATDFIIFYKGNTNISTK